MFKKIDRNYVSETDKFLNSLTRLFGFKADSQQAEIQKYDRINRLRDNPNAKDDRDDLL